MFPLNIKIKVRVKVLCEQNSRSYQGNFPLRPSVGGGHLMLQRILQSCEKYHKCNQVK